MTEGQLILGVFIAMFVVQAIYQFFIKSDEQKRKEREEYKRKRDFEERLKHEEERRKEQERLNAARKRAKEQAIKMQREEELKKLKEEREHTEKIARINQRPLRSGYSGSSSRIERITDKVITTVIVSTILGSIGFLVTGSWTVGGATSVAGFVGTLLLNQSS